MRFYVNTPKLIKHIKIDFSYNSLGENEESIEDFM